MSETPNTAASTPVELAEATDQATPLPPVPEVLPEAGGDAAGDEAAASPAAAVEPSGLSPAQTAAKLAELFPALFGLEPKPIKLRIQTDIQERAPGVFQRRTLSWFLSRHTTTNAYIKALLQSQTRFDLDGQPAGDISEEHKLAAQEELARRRAIAQAKRQAERQAERQGGDPRRAQGPGPRQPLSDAQGQHQGQAQGPAQADMATPPRPAEPGQPNRPPRQERHGPRSAGRSDAPPGSAESPRHQRPQRPQGQQGARSPLGQGASAGPRGQGPRSDRHEGRDRPVHPDRHARREQPAQQRHQAANSSPPSSAVAGPGSPQDPAQRDRWQLLRAWESSALSKTNFCTLKRLTEAEFDAQIALAQKERAGARGG